MQPTKSCRLQSFTQKATLTALPQIPSPNHIYFLLFFIAREVVKSQMKFTACCMVTELWQTA